MLEMRFDYDLVVKGTFLVYVTLLLLAAAFDSWRFVIPNAISLCLVGAFVIGMSLQPFPVSWWSHLGAGTAALALGLVLFGLRIIGGGDAKLVAAVAFWAGFGHLPQLLLYIGLAGGAVTLAIFALRRAVLATGVPYPRLAQGALPRILVCGEQIPYGLAIAAGGLYLGFDHPQLGLYLLW